MKVKGLAPMAIEKLKILGAILELPAIHHCQFRPFGPFSWAGLAVLFIW